MSMDAKNIVSLKYLWAMALLLSSSTALGFFSDQTVSAFKSVEFSAAGGFSWSQVDNTTLIVSPYETDSVLLSHVSNTPIWKLGVGESFFQNILSQRKFFNKLLVQLNVYYISPTLYGNVWQYQDSLFNNYSFRAPVTSYRLMLDIKPVFFTWSRYSPYAILGIGAAWNKISYTETVTDPGVNPISNILLSDKMSTNFAYNLGLGARADFSPKWSVSLEYIYSDLGKLTPDHHSENGTALMTPPTFSLRNQAVLLGLNWKI